MIDPGFKTLAGPPPAPRKDIDQTPDFVSQLLEAIPAPVFYKDTEQIYRGCNRAFADFLGQSRERIVGRTVFEVAPPTLAQRYFEQDSALLAAPGVQVYEADVETASGRRTVIFHKATYAAKDGAVAGLVGVILDITERRRAEERLRKALKRLRSLSTAREFERRKLELILENTDDGVALLDCQGSISFTNSSLRRMLEQAEIAAPRSLARLAELYELRDEQDRPLSADSSLVARARAGKRIADLELRLRCKRSGRQLPVLVSALPLRDADTDVRQLVITIHDLSKQKHAQQVLSRVPAAWSTSAPSPRPYRIALSLRCPAWLALSWRRSPCQPLPRSSSAATFATSLCFPRGRSWPSSAMSSARASGQPSLLRGSARRPAP